MGVRIQVPLPQIKSQAETVRRKGPLDSARTGSLLKGMSVGVPRGLEVEEGHAPLPFWAAGLIPGPGCVLWS